MSLLDNWGGGFCTYLCSSYEECVGQAKASSLSPSISSSSVVLPSSIPKFLRCEDFEWIGSLIRWFVDLWLLLGEGKNWSVGSLAVLEGVGESTSSSVGPSPEWVGDIDFKGTLLLVMPGTVAITPGLCIETFASWDNVESVGLGIGGEFELRWVTEFRLWLSWELACKFAIFWLRPLPATRWKAELEALAFGPFPTCSGTKVEKNH